MSESDAPDAPKPSAEDEKAAHEWFIGWFGDDPPEVGAPNSAAGKYWMSLAHFRAQARAEGERAGYEKGFEAGVEAARPRR